MRVWASCFWMCVLGCGGAEATGLNYGDTSQWQRVSIHGQQYFARNSHDFSGAGNNRWSSKQVVAQAHGAFEMRLSDIDGSLYASELVQDPPIEGGVSISSQIKLQVNAMDPQTVFGFFLYRNDSSEFDIEITEWGKDGSPNLHFSVHSDTHRTKSFRLPADSEELSLRLCAAEGKVSFEVRAKDQVFMWRTDEELPENFPNRIHMNLWSRTPKRSVSESVLVREFGTEKVKHCN